MSSSKELRRDSTRRKPPAGLAGTAARRGSERNDVAGARALCSSGGARSHRQNQHAARRDCQVFDTMRRLTSGARS